MGVSERSDWITHLCGDKSLNANDKERLHNDQITHSTEPFIRCIENKHKTAKKSWNLEIVFTGILICILFFANKLKQLLQQKLLS